MQKYNGMLFWSWFTLLNRNVAMYRAKRPLCLSRVFREGTYVVSIRPHRKQNIDLVRNSTRKYSGTHGEPIC
ncbi:hypothetical protein BKA56DRAFT_22724 [Ilyonectria sp. MPI-CAGE-AT-0026]|nr:hypothetical protein BKA56DRAFT_22724 [Ilyonectria sp. MPI-CAGE-AT-0026]